MRVDVWADLVCPWCYLGKRRFERALESFEHRDEVEVVHHSFQLDPNFPRGQVTPTEELLAGKYGMTLEQAEAAQRQMEERAAADGLEYHLEGNTMGNTVDGHRLVHFAASLGLADELLERLYRAHFTEQRSVFDHDSLATLAAEVGIDAGQARKVLASEDFTEDVAADQKLAKELGANGVPFFVLAEKYGVSGAQTSEVFGQALERAWADKA